MVPCAYTYYQYEMTEYHAFEYSEELITVSQSALVEMMIIRALLQCRHCVDKHRKISFF